MGSNRTSNARALRALIWAQRALKSTLKRSYERSPSARALVALERRSWALTSARERRSSSARALERRSWALTSARDERPRALVSKTGLITSGHYLLFFDRRRALWYERSWALVVPIARERSSAHFDFALWIRIWALPFKFNQYMTNPKMLHQQNKKGNYQIAVPALIWRLQ